MIKNIAICSILFATGGAHALGSLNATVTDTGGKVAFNNSAMGTNTKIAFSPTGQPYLTSSKAFTIPGAKAPITLALKQPIQKAAAAKAMTGLLRLSPVGTVIGVSSVLYDYFQDQNMDNVRFIKGSDFEGIQYTDITESNFFGYSPSCKTCNQFVNQAYQPNPQSDAPIGTADTNGWCTYNQTFYFTNEYGVRTGSFTHSNSGGYAPNPDCKSSTVTDVSLTMDQLEDKIASESGWPSSTTLDSPYGRALTEALKNPNIKIETQDQPTITGPTSVAGTTKTSTAQLPSGATQTTNTTTNYKINYAGDTYNITNTTTTVYNDGTTTTTKTEESDTLDKSPIEEKEDLSTEKPPVEEKPEEEEEPSTFSGQCESTPSCSGDSILCAIAQATFATNCVAQQIAKPDDAAESIARAARDGTDGTSTDTLKKDAKQIAIENFNTTGSSWSRSCPVDPEFSLPFSAESFKIPFNKICTPLQIFSNIGVSITLLASLIWVLGLKQG